MFCNNITIMLTGQNMYERRMWWFTLRAIRFINQWCWDISATLIFGRLSDLGENACVKPENEIQLSPIPRHPAEMEGVLSLT